MQQVKLLQNKITAQIIIAVLGAALSVACFITGYFIFVFLLPLTLAAFWGGPKTAWASGILAVTANALVFTWFYLYQGASLFIVGWSALYYTVMVLIFTWINVPLGKIMIFRDTTYRMVAGAAFCTLVFVPLFLWIMKNDQIRSLITRELEAFGSLSGTSDISDSAIAEGMSSRISVILRGGIPISCLVFWWVNRQFGLLFSRIFRHDRVLQTGNFLGFRAPFMFIWVLSFSLGAILIGRIWKIELLDICGWNILALSAILFFVQGAAIVMHMILRLPPMLRIIINVGIIYLFFRPGVNQVLAGLLVLLGIAENWVPFRVPKQQGE